MHLLTCAPCPRGNLKALSDELRAYVLDSVSKTGGHFSSNLGTVELTVALHHVFNTPYDRMVWDVGHQTYPHKILTGRRDRMSTPCASLTGSRAFRCAAKVNTTPLGWATPRPVFRLRWAWPWPPSAKAKSAVPSR